jgi:hypothetical protein
MDLPPPHEDTRRRQSRISAPLLAVQQLISVIEPGYTKTQFDTNFLEADPARLKLRYTAGAGASRLRLLRRFAPPGAVDAGIRKELQLDALTASLSSTPVLAK